MKNEILLLIRCDLINARMINGLNKMEIEASVYRLDLATVILGLMGVKEDQRTDELYQQYFDLLESYGNFSSRKALKKVSATIYGKLGKIVKQIQIK